MTCLRLRPPHSATDTEQDFKVDAIEKAGIPHPHRLSDIYELGAEFSAGKIATAVAGPSRHQRLQSARCEASKIATKSLTSSTTKGSLPAEKRSSKISAANSSPTKNPPNWRSPPPATTPRRISPKHTWHASNPAIIRVTRLYPDERRHEQTLQSIRHAVRDKKLATCLGFGPRFLHSTESLTKADQTRCSCKSRR